MGSSLSFQRSVELHVRTILASINETNVKSEAGNIMFACLNFNIFQDIKMCAVVNIDTHLTEAAQPERFPDLTELPPELSLAILANLNATDLCLAACVWNDLAQDDILWMG